jgi:hypothetical protein
MKSATHHTAVKAPNSHGQQVHGQGQGHAQAPSGARQDPQSMSKSAAEKINMEEYAYNKIFVGGLHYDTRDGEPQFTRFLCS